MADGRQEGNESTKRLQGEGAKVAKGQKGAAAAGAAKAPCPA